MQRSFFPVDHASGKVTESRHDGTSLPPWSWQTLILGMLLLWCASPGTAQQAKDYFAKPGETTLTVGNLPAGVYQVSFRLHIGNQKSATTPATAPDDTPAETGETAERAYSVTPLAMLDVNLPGYPSVLHKAVTPLHFDAANTPQEFSFLLDNFKSQEVTATVSLQRNTAPAPKLSVDQIHLVACPRVCIGKVWPGKILYYTNETANGFAVIYNGTPTVQTVNLRCLLESDLAQTRPVREGPLTLQPGERREVPLTWNTGKEEYGFSLAATLTDAAGNQLDQRREYFSVADNLWKVGMTIGGMGSGVTNGPGPNEAIPVDQVKKAEALLAAELAKPPVPAYWSYGNYQEFFAWSPDNYFLQAPETDYWYSGIGNYTMGKRWIQLAVELMHRTGRRATSYVLPWSGGYGGEVAFRRHPDWFVYDKSGQLSWSGYQKKLEVGSNINGTENPWKLQLAPYACCLSPNIANPGAIDAFIEQVAKSQAMFKFDGIRFDTAVFGAYGYDIAGRPIDNNDPKRKNELEVNAWKRMRDMLWQKLGKNFVIGNNEDYELYIHNNGPEWEESCRQGCLLMEEVPRSSTSPQSPRNRWHDYLTYYLKTGEIVRALGGHHLTIAFDQQNAVDSLYLNILTYAMRTHPYGYYHNDDLPLGNYAQFVTRYSALLWDVERVKLLPNPEQKIAVRGAAPIWWKELACTRQAPNGKRQLILHLINPPVQERILTDPTNKVPVPQTNVQVTVKTAPGETIAHAWLLSAEPVTHQEALPLTAGDGQVTVTVPRLDFWSLVVFE